MARLSCLRLFWHFMRLAASRTFCTAGSSRPIKMAMMARTTNSSMSVNAYRRDMMKPPARDERRVGGQMNFHFTNWRGWVFIFLFAAGCGSRPPYEGKSVAQLEKMLQDADPAVQAQGAFGLSQHGPAAKEATPALAMALKSEQVAVRQNAALALG